MTTQLFFLWSFLILGLCSKAATTYYEVWRSTSPYSIDAVPIKRWITSTSYEDTGVTPGQHYFYWVRALSCNEIDEAHEVAIGLWYSGTMVIPIKSKCDSESPVKLKVQITNSNPAISLQGPLDCSLRESDGLLWQSYESWSQNISVSITSPWQKEWTYDVDISENATFYGWQIGEAEVYFRYDFESRSFSSQNSTVAISDISDVGPNNAASQGTYSDKVIITWGATTNVCSEIDVTSSSEGWTRPPNQAPNMPSCENPADTAIGVWLETDLDWSCSDPDSGDTVYYTVYFEKNDPSPDSIIKNDATGSYADLEALDYGSHYYWQVRADDHNGGVTISPVWHFQTQTALPLITSLPCDVRVFAGETAVFGVEAVSPADFPLTYQWYKGTSGDTGNLIAGATGNTLIIDAAGLSDEGLYWCQVMNTAGSVDTWEAALVIKRIIAHYKFDNTLDDEIEANNGVLKDTNGAPATPVFTTDVTRVTAAALSLAGSTYVDIGTGGYPNASVGGGLVAGSVSVWANISAAGTESEYNFFGTKRSTWNEDWGGGMIRGFYRPEAGGNRLFLNFQEAAGTTVLSSCPLPSGKTLCDGQWHLVTFAWDCVAQVNFYVDGVSIGTWRLWTPLWFCNNWDRPMVIGGLMGPDGTTAPPYTFMGALDDYRVYNYPLDGCTVAELYTDFAPRVPDFTGEGNVSLVDFSIFAAQWGYENCDFPCWCERADLNFTGSVDMDDFIIFAEYWLHGT